MITLPVKTDVFHAGDDLNAFLLKHLKGQSLDGKVLCITSKIVSLAENQLLSKEGISKCELVEREAEHYLCEGGYGSELTIKHGILIPSAGIDESNSESDKYILFPKDPFASAAKIGAFLRQQFSVKNFAVIITDSHTMPLRRGVTGISLAHWGLKGTRSLVGQPDIFKRPLKFTHVDVVDALAASAVFVMGEADDCNPLALVAEAQVEFTDSTNADEIRIEPDLDMYYPLLSPYLKNKS